MYFQGVPQPLYLCHFCVLLSLLTLNLSHFDAAASFPFFSASQTGKYILLFNLTNEMEGALPLSFLSPSRTPPAMTLRHYTLLGSIQVRLKREKKIEKLHTMHACASMCAYMRVRLQCACRISPCQSSIACFLFFFVNPAILFGALVLLKSAMHTYICCGYGISLDTRELYRFPCPLMVSTRRS